MNGKPLVRHAPAVLAFAAAAALYWSTSARSPGWGDATLILDSARTLSLGVWANTHNLYNLLGHGWLLATPFLDPHRSLTLLSVLLGALTVLCLYLVALDVTRSTAAALLTAAAMAVSHSLWWHATTIEVYTLNSLLIALMMLFVFRYLRGGGLWRLCVAFAAAGLSTARLHDACRASRVRAGGVPAPAQAAGPPAGRACEPGGAAGAAPHGLAVAGQRQAAGLVRPPVSRGPPGLRPMGAC